MDLDRRAFVAAVLAGGVGATQVGPLPQYLDSFAALSGDAWQSATATVPDEVSSPHGDASVRYDDQGVPTIEADGDDALYFATGYVQAANRLFQMDLFRRRMSGTLAAAVGEQGVGTDLFNAQLDFRAAAEANVEALSGTDAADALEAYADGVNAYREDNPLPFEFHLLDYEPDPWTPADSMLIEKQISWGLTGSFRTLRKAAVAEAFGGDWADRLHPDRLDHDSPILREYVTFGSGDGGGDDSEGTDGGGADGEGRDGGSDGTATHVGAPSADFLRAVEPFERDPGVGSNSWVVSGEQTASGRPLLANDPHLTLLAPPVWFEMHQRLPEMAVSGVAFPGVPFVVIGENDRGAWGFTNAGADVIDFYTYEIDGDRYRYDGEWREFDTEQRTIEVADGEDREMTVRKTVHGPLIERQGDRYGVAWTGFMGTRTSQAIYELNRSEGLDDARTALELFEQPTQNAVYADTDGNTYYVTTGLLPLRHTDGEVVPGDRIFDGSAGEGEWPGYTPYAPPDLDAGGFVPFEDKPSVENSDYLATANQRIVDDEALDFYIAESYAPPFRGARIYDLLDERANADDSFDFEFVRRVQRDTYDRRADLIVDAILDARSEMSARARDAADALEGWDRLMDRDSEGALVFERFVPKYKTAVFGPAFEAAGLSANAYPNDWVLLTMAPDDPWFADPPPGQDRTQSGAIAEAMDRTAAELEEEGWRVYGDYNRTAIDHPFGLDFLNYERLPTDGSPGTVFNFRKESGTGSSYRLLAHLNGEPSLTVIPGGNDGDYTSDHYDDQLEHWADGEYTELTATTDGDPDVAFESADGGDGSE